MEYRVLNAIDMPDRLLPLFDEYRAFLMVSEPLLEPFLKMQSFDDETEHLKDKYLPPFGGIYIVEAGGDAEGTPCEDAGCIAFRRLDDENCELKRVFLREKFRGCGISRAMMETVIEDAKKQGYKYMLLDTLPVLESALRLYEKLGFEETEKYNDNPLSHAIFLRLTL